MFRILLIGPLPPPLGGATVLFSQLVDELRTDPNLRITVINTARDNNSVLRNFSSFGKVLMTLINEVSSHDVVGFHASNKGALLFAPFVYLVCKFNHKPWLFRGFGGYFHDWFQSLGRFARWVFIHTLLKADAILLETKASVEFFETFDSKLPLFWYSNSRKRQQITKSNLNKLATRFIFLGHVSLAKGVSELIYAAEHLEDITIDVYGPLKDSFKPDSFTNNISYCGILEPNLVSQKISEYDALILPSKYSKEGYPGVIIEAFCEGIPVIASNIGAISEIVDSESGILIEPGNKLQLIDAIEMLHHDPDLFHFLKNGATTKGEQFCSIKWTNTYIALSRKLVDTCFDNNHKSKG